MNTSAEDPQILGFKKSSNHLRTALDVVGQY